MASKTVWRIHISKLNDDNPDYYKDKEKSGLMFHRSHGIIIRLEW